MKKQYKVVHDFKDLEDKNQRIYRKGDAYEGQPTEERLAALTTKNNAIKEVLIAEVLEEKEADGKEAAAVAKELKGAEEFSVELGVEYDGEGITPDPAAETTEKPKAKGKKAKAE
ncbi:hypothetical protein [Enterococcus casseliflavus]|uniref:hypothetical protein n=1 Tax=Enterococcus TaxID=1350 RepID=UPI00119DC871|nr:hypothetical protein [Enterococcus casseliflavus]